MPRSSLASGVPLGRGEGAKEKARRVAGRMPASSLSAHGCAVSEPPQRPRDVAGLEPGDRGRGGALLFGYFLLGKQEKVTRAQGCARNAHGRGTGFAKNAEDQRRSKAKARSWIPAFAGMTKLREAFAGDDEESQVAGSRPSPG